MKKLIITCMSLLIVVGSYAQKRPAPSNDRGKVTLAAYIPDQVEGLPDAARNMLGNKLNQIISQNGFGGDEGQRFIITSNIVVASKDMLSTAPPMTALVLDVNLYIGDGYEGTKFASTILSVKGVGENEAKAYINAFKNISLDSPKLQAFVEKGKEKIIAYYNTHCDVIIKQAQTLANTGRMEEAIYNLTSVPQACTNCYARSMAQVAPIYKKQIEKACSVKLAQAKTVFTANQDVNGANAAGEILQQIDPSATCYKEVKVFIAQMGKRVKEIDNREWSFKLQEQKNDMSIINAARDVAVAYAAQPRTTVYNVHGWW
ncbi:MULTISPECIES: hypothetical protein [unclassified Mucilaginibacter]|uniref:hypothetical protein n=1 Tax=unclassified Mucilaginibacter TaxID=2617802 RepID=UPI002AC98413|nr:MULTISPECIES: hypothetical protein [unclassified Mucilaginibacter]MEB0248867.1 hypothetical protein [Mucilaginibacter sp. 5B2]MEB0260222.1 hypothetical protein [Mucilaginibacter sp. 10I4]MEB0277367.1 hypothetical protein [Mucilaginibacter sp. 10B2]MEB0300151.1 hypothetical protein [Mucilaginibacter sp. 5C4]WPX25491.1 hypothetical protein RHM67_09460 [Mucilaginibacter sp. 5C4]